MAEQQNVTIDAAGCLGRALTTLGVVWAGIAILASFGALNEFGFGRGFFATQLASLFPALLLLAAGRALRRRSRAAGAEAQIPSPAPARTGKRVPTSRVEPAQKAPLPPPVIETPKPPPTKPAPRAVETVRRAPEPTPTTPSAPVESPLPISRVPGSARTATPPKTSQELIQEAHKRWGIRSRR